MASSISCGVFEAYSDAIDAGILEGKAHGGLAVTVLGEPAFANELHADDAHALFFYLPDVGDHFVDVAEFIGVMNFGVHACPCGSCGSSRFQATCCREPGECGRPCNEAPRARIGCFDCASRTPSCQRAVSDTQSEVCCQCSSMMSKYSVLEVRRI